MTERNDQEPKETPRGEAASHADDGWPGPGGPPTRADKRRFARRLAGILALLVLGGLLASPLRAGLRGIGAALTGTSASEGTEGNHYFTCGMHPWVIQPKPGDCPICGMQLVPLDPAKFSGEVTISPEVAQNIGVRVEEVTEGTAGGALRTVGTVTYDETRLVDVNLKVSGWIEKLYVDYQGKPVKRGQKLFDLYSPELYAAEEEYLLAYRAARRPGAAENRADEGALGGTLLEAARTKLALFDVGQAQIAALEARGKPSRTVTIYSPQSGIVVDKQAFEGMKVTPGMSAYRIADLSQVWVIATVYEYQSGQIKVGQEATMTLSYLPGEAIKGKILYIYPYLNERTRQISVRLAFANPKLSLKPGMYATVVFAGNPTAKQVQVSRSAIIDTGERQMAFVALGQGRFEPRVVHMGAETGEGKVQILDGLAPGERVVTSGQFLIDSEARMREALARMMKGTPAGEATVPPPEDPGSAGPTATLPKAAEAALGAALDGYLAIGQGLADDTDRDLGIAARKVADALGALVGMAIPDQPHFWHQHAEAETVRQKAAELATAPNLAEARRIFAGVSRAFIQLLRATGIPAGYPQKLQTAHCPMYPEGDPEGAEWIQPDGPIRNPYFGKTMLTCSDRQRPFAVAK